jgi:hypothetical protein
MHPVAADLFQLLIHVGAVPGQDFSCDPVQQAYHLNDRCYQLLQTAYPDVDWQDILGQPYAGVDEQIAILHDALGCTFVPDLVQQMRDRLSQLSDDQAAGYVQAILIGVESATGITLYPFLLDSLDLAEQARLEWLLRQNVVAIPGGACLIDVLKAAGASDQDYEVEQGEALLTEAGWRRLSLVWDSDCTLDSTVQSWRSR